MGLIRLLFLLLIIWIIWFMYKNYQLKQEQRGQQRKLDAGRIVKCRYCDVHLPQQQALSHAEDWFCTPAHKQAWLADSNKT